MHLKRMCFCSYTLFLIQSPIYLVYGHARFIFAAKVWKITLIMLANWFSQIIRKVSFHNHYRFVVAQLQTSKTDQVYIIAFLPFHYWNTFTKICQNPSAFSLYIADCCKILFLKVPSCYCSKRTIFRKCAYDSKIIWNQSLSRYCCSNYWETL